MRGFTRRDIIAIKNLMGIIGSRLRGLGRKAEGAQRGEFESLRGRIRGSIRRMGGVFGGDEKRIKFTQR